MSRKKNPPNKSEITKSNPNQHGNNNDDRIFNQSHNVIYNENTKTGNNKQINEHCLILANNVIKNLD